MVLTCWWRIHLHPRNWSRLGADHREVNKIAKKSKPPGDISEELAALDAVIEGASALAKEAMDRKADLKQGKLASKSFGRTTAEVRARLKSRLKS